MSEGNLRLIKRHTAVANRRKRLGHQPAPKARADPFENHVATLDFKEPACSCKGQSRHSSSCVKRFKRSEGACSVQANTPAPNGVLVWEQRIQTRSRKIMPKPRPPASSTPFPLMMQVPPTITPPEALRLPELIFKCSSDFVSSTFLSWPRLNSPSTVATSIVTQSAWSPLPTTYLLLFKLAFDIIDTGRRFMVTAFQIFDVLLAYAPHLLKLETPSGFFAYMYLMVNLLGPAYGLGQVPDGHRQLRGLLRRQLALTARVVLGRLHPLTVVAEALIAKRVDPQLAASQIQVEESIEASNNYLQQVVDKTGDTWGQHSAQHMIVSCHHEGGLRGEALQVTWAQPAGNVDEDYSSKTQQECTVPALDEVAVVSPASGGTSATFSTAIELLHTQVPALSSLMPIVMRLFAAVDDMQRDGLETPVIDEAQPGREVASTIRALLQCLATDDAVKIHLGWRLRADGNYALAIQHPAQI